jgi:hypothetical protein
MRRVAVLGNSHLGALKRAWDAGLAKSQAELELVFFGAPRRTLVELRAIRDELTTEDPSVRKSLALTSGMTDPRVRLRTYDAVLLHGLIGRNWAVPLALKLDEYSRGTGSFVSTGLVQDILREDFRNSVLQHVVQLIRSISQVPLFVSPQPFICEDVTYRQMHNALQPPLLPQLYERYIESEVTAAALIYVPQNPVTVVDHCFTRRGFAVDGIRLRTDTTHDPGDDLRHKNESYGRIVIDDFLSKLRSSAPFSGARGRASTGTPATE